MEGAGSHESLEDQKDSEMPPVRAKVCKVEIGQGGVGSCSVPRASSSSGPPGCIPAEESCGMHSHRKKHRTLRTCISLTFIGPSFTLHSRGQGPPSLGQPGRTHDGDVTSCPQSDLMTEQGRD